MELILPILMFALGLVLIVKGGDAFVDAASWIAQVSGIPPFIVGATIVSLATTLPEMMVSVLAAANGQVDMANGNAIGSVTANTGLILAIAMIAIPSVIKRRDYLFKSLLLIGCVVTLLVFSQGGQLKWAGSIVLAVLFFVFMAENVHSAKSARSSLEARPEANRKAVVTNAVLFILGAAGIVIGAHLLVENGSTLARMLGVPESIIAVTLVAVGTSLPELVTTITAIMKKQASMSAGNVIGANIIDCALILPICSLVSGQQLPISRQCLTLDLPFCLATVLIALIPALYKQKFMRWQGWLCLAVYTVYIGLVIF